MSSVLTFSDSRTVSQVTTLNMNTMMTFKFYKIEFFSSCAHVLRSIRCSSICDEISWFTSYQFYLTNPQTWSCCWRYAHPMSSVFKTI